MLIVSYDISDDRVRAKFSKFLSKFGYRMQYSVFRIKNSQRILQNILSQVNGVFMQQFCETDSVIIMCLSKRCKIHYYGYAKHEEQDLIVVR